MLSVKNLTKTYKGRAAPAVNDVSFELKAGEICGFLGLNGAGKTTTFKCVAGILPFEKGEIKICGLDIKKQELKSKRCLSYIPDNHAVFEELSGNEYVNFLADMYGVCEKERKERTEELASILNLRHAMNQQIKTYSHGMKQKIAIIGGVVHRPKVWILDEPLVGLDPISIRQIQDFMLDYAKEGNAIIFSSHILEIVEKLCSKVILIDEGKIAEQHDLTQEKIDLHQVFFRTVKQ